MALLCFCRIYIKKSKIKTQTKNVIVHVNCDIKIILLESNVIKSFNFANQSFCDTFISTGKQVQSSNSKIRQLYFISFLYDTINSKVPQITANPARPVCTLMLKKIQARKRHALTYSSRCTGI